MTIKLQIGEYCIAEQEIDLPKFKELSFEDNCTLRKFYVGCIQRKMELECVSMIRGRKYQFVIVAESRVNDILSFEAEIQMNGLKKVV